MAKLIKNWEELSKVPANNKYKIIVNDYSGWIVPICDEPSKEDNFICNCKKNMKTIDYLKEHVYLSTHTFYGKHYEFFTKQLQEHGFDIEIDDWDKEIIGDNK